MKKYAIILAGGKGKRIQSTVPKQFIEIDKKPMIVHAIEQFTQFDPSIELIIVLPIDQRDAWVRIQKSFLANQKLTLTNGGGSRSQSVRSGLKSIPNEGLVAIHDAARPFVHVRIIKNSYDSAQKFGSGVPMIELKDSIRKIQNGCSIAQDRHNFRLVQTPQTFRIPEIKKAYEQVKGNNFSDDASRYEAAGFEVKMIEGANRNIKITTPEDFIINTDHRYVNNPKKDSNQLINYPA